MGGLLQSGRKSPGLNSKRAARGETALPGPLGAEAVEGQGPQEPHHDPWAFNVGKIDAHQQASRAVRPDDRRATVGPA